MDVTVLANHVALDYLAVEDVGHTVHIVMTGQNLEVAVIARDGHVVVQHILTREVYHRCYRIVEHRQHRIAATILETREILVVGRHVLSGKRCHGVGKTHVRGVFHQLSLQHVAGAVLLVRQRSDEDGIVNHRREQQFRLLRVRQLLIAADTELVVSACKEPCESIIIGRKDGLTTRLVQNLRIPQVLYQLTVRCERAL